MNVVKAIFLRENKRRFSGQVLINGIEESCYIASSSHLKNIIDLENKEVLLIPVKSCKSLFKYTLYAIKNDDEYMIVNLNISNEIVRRELNSKLFNFLGNRKNSKNEYKIDGYKSDIYLPNEKTIIEVKSLISIEEEALFPIMYSKRFEEQLFKFSDLLEQQNIVWLFIISYGSNTQKIYLDTKNKCWEIFHKCKIKGMKIKAFSCGLTDTYDPKIFEREIEISDLIIE